MILHRCLTTAATKSTSKILVVGAGTIGLRTALELSKRGQEVVVRAPDVRDTCSVGAGGFWMPFHCHDSRVDTWSIQTLDELLHLSVDSDDLVEIVPAVKLLRENSYTDRVSSSSLVNFPRWTRDERLNFQHLTVEMLAWQNVVHQLRIPSETQLKKAGYLFAWFWNSPIVNTTAMLQYFIDQLTDVHNMDVQVQGGESCPYYSSLEEMQAAAVDLGCDAVLNCTGLGSRELVPDDSLIPARGALLKFNRSTCQRRFDFGGTRDAVITCEEPPWASETHPAYLIPRHETIVVGGTYLLGDEEGTIREEERQQLWQHAQLLGGIESPPVGEWVGFRPFRNPVRCEWDRNTTNLPIFHSYGYGGSGWTVNVGAAKECANQMIQTLNH